MASDFLTNFTAEEGQPTPENHPSIVLRGFFYRLVRIRRYKCFVQIAVLNISRELLYVQRAMWPLLMSLLLE